MRLDGWVRRRAAQRQQHLSLPRRWARRRVQKLRVAWSAARRTAAAAAAQLLARASKTRGGGSGGEPARAAGGAAGYCAPHLAAQVGDLGGALALAGRGVGEDLRDGLHREAPPCAGGSTTSVLHCERVWLGRPGQRRALEDHLLARRRLKARAITQGQRVKPLQLQPHRGGERSAPVVRWRARRTTPLPPRPISFPSSYASSSPGM